MLLWGLNYHFYKPSNDKYSVDQWLWDSGSHMIVWSHKNVTNSMLDLRSMLQIQLENGKIPEEIFWADRSKAQEDELKLQWSSTRNSDITQSCPLLLPDLPEEKVARLVAQLQDENKYATSFAIPTVAKDDPHFYPTFPVDLMWRGPVWGFTNWFVNYVNLIISETQRPY